MFKSKTCFRVSHNGLVSAVPVSYFAIIQSARPDYKPDDVAREALSHYLNRRVSTGTTVTVDRKQPIDEHGDPIANTTFTVNEHFNGFSLTHNPTGENHWLSDGVDVIGFDDEHGYNDEELTLYPGTIGFTELWSEYMNDDHETIDAYFPHLRETDTNSTDEDYDLIPGDKRQGLFDPERDSEE